MKHSKRMVLVPEDFLSRLERQNKQETSPIVKGLVHLDENLDRILTRTDLADSDKQKLYHTNLEHYMGLKDQKTRETPTVNISLKHGLSDNTSDNTTPREMDDSVVLDSVPKRMRARAESVLKQLKKHPNMISWNRSGQTNLEGKTIHDSNISDLIVDALRGRQNFNPKGSREFFKILSKINMPRDLIRNESRWKQVNTTSNEENESSEDKYITKKYLTIPKKPKSKQFKAPKSIKNVRWLPY